ncbi:MAG: AI-2E family transporter [Moraxellaceae bacterium]|nr:AI-2E family transporter [Moraxellaceae bacterium]
MSSFEALTLHRLILAVILTLLFILGYNILEVFLTPMAWAGVLAYVTWPAYQYLLRHCGQRANLAAALMTVTLALLIIVPLLLAIVMLRVEASNVYQIIADKMSHQALLLPSFMQKWPFANELQKILDDVFANPTSFKEQLQTWFQKGFGAAAQVAGSIGKNLGKLSMAIFTLFFFYRDGQSIMRQIQQGLTVLIGERVHGYIKSIGDTTRAVVYGIVLTAVAQGFLAGLGYAVVGMDSPIFLAAVTTLVAMIPFGTPFAWGSVAVWLFTQGYTIEALSLAAWGTFVISWVDNIIRPLVISSATQIHFLLVMFGVLGGLSAFGMIGLFIGPVILAVLAAVWREWLESERDIAI